MENLTDLQKEIIKNRMKIKKLNYIQNSVLVLSAFVFISLLLTI